MISGQKITHAVESMPLYPSSRVFEWGTTLVVASHPDDETLGCGGAIALLRQMGYRVRVLIVSDGNDAPQAENKSFSLEKLGICEEAVTKLNIAGSLVPASSEPGFEELVRVCRNEIGNFLPETVLLPWRRDPNRDRRAVWQIVRQALQDEALPVRQLENSVNSWESYVPSHLPKPDEAVSWRLDTSTVAGQKLQALGRQDLQYQISTEDASSQHYTFSSDVGEQTLSGWEIYLEPHFT
ncbi:MAG: PIG-L deacetylase family protein [Cyclobacteriaceae bacterium]